MASVQGGTLAWRAAGKPLASAALIPQGESRLSSRFGPQIEVLEPEALREQVIQAAESSSAC